MVADMNREYERHLAYLAYLLGYSSGELPSQLQLQWEWADPGDPLPDPVVNTLALVELCLRELLVAPGLPSKPRLHRAIKSAREVLAQVRQDLKRVWGSTEHTEYMQFRLEVEGELDSHMMMRN